MDGADARRSYGEVRSPIHHFPKQSLRDRTAANISSADEEDVFHSRFKVSSGQP